jgi:hypothetical protein
MTSERSTQRISDGHWTVSDGRETIGSVDLVDAVFVATDVAGNVVGRFASLRDATGAFGAGLARASGRGPSKKKKKGRAQ